MSGRTRRNARKLCGGLIGGAELRNRFLTSRIDREHAVETGDLEDLRDVAVAAHERELAVVRAQPLDAADEHPEGGRVDEGRIAEVDDDVLAALADHLEELLLELRSRVEIDLPGERNDVGVVSQLLRLDIEVHSSPGIEYGGRSGSARSLTTEGRPDRAKGLDPL